MLISIFSGNYFFVVDKTVIVKFQCHCLPIYCPLLTMTILNRLTETIKLSECIRQYLIVCLINHDIIGREINESKQLPGVTLGYHKQLHYTTNFHNTHLQPKGSFLSSLKYIVNGLFLQ